MKVSRFTVNSFGVNCYVLWDSDSREAAIVDPGMSAPEERAALDAFIEREHLKPVHLIDTHLHIDHTLGNLYVRDIYGLKLAANPADDFLGNALTAQARAFGMPVNVTDHASEIHLRDGERIYVGKEPVDILAVPGHSPGSIALYAPESGFVITGDALFRGSIGPPTWPEATIPLLSARYARNSSPCPTIPPCFPATAPNRPSVRRNAPILISDNTA